MPDRVQKITYTFQGWESDDLAKLYHGSVDYFDAESAAGRSLVRESDFGIMKVTELTDEKPPDGTVIGAKLEVSFDSSKSSPEKVDQFFSLAGLKVERS